MKVWRQRVGSHSCCCIFSLGVDSSRCSQFTVSMTVETAYSRQTAMPSGTLRLRFWEFNLVLGWACRLLAKSKTSTNKSFLMVLTSLKVNKMDFQNIVSAAMRIYIVTKRTVYQQKVILFTYQLFNIFYDSINVYEIILLHFI